MLTPVGFEREPICQCIRHATGNLAWPASDFFPGDHPTEGATAWGSALTTAADAVKSEYQTVAVAQLVERQVVVLDVAGSSPVGYPWTEMQKSECKMQNNVSKARCLSSFCILHFAFCIPYFRGVLC